MPLYGVVVGERPQEYAVLSNGSLVVIKRGRVDRDVALRPPPLAGLHEIEVNGLTVLVQALGQERMEPDAIVIQ